MDIKRTINRRAILVGILISLLFFLLIARTFYIQSIEASMLKEKATNIWNSSMTINPKRGTVFDRNGERLAYNAPAYTVVAVLSKDYSNHVSDPVMTAEELAPILDMPKRDIYSLLTKDVYQVELRPGGWKVDKEVAEQIKELNLPGIILKEETKRYYPNNAFVSYAIGFLNYDNEAVMGVEKEYDTILKGTPGELKVKKDLKGYELPDGEEFFQPAKDGSNITLTIDKTIQQYVENALDKAESMYHPKRITAIAADPNTGEILAMANRPTFNPNQYWNIENYYNFATSYQFEPGSTFKIITLAATIEENIFDPDGVYQSGTIQVPGGVIHDHNNGLGWGKITFLEGVKRSSNVAFVILGYQMLGKEKLFSYIDKFGFGKTTGIDLPNESKGIMKKAEDAYPLDVAAISFGQGLAVTPIQQIMAVSAIANGGELIKPHVVKEIRESKTNEIITINQPTVISRVVSEETARFTREILEEVVEFGKEKNGYIEGYHIAGKTGTAQKLEPDGTYSKNRSIASFIGFAPANDPKLLVYVVVDEPDLSIPYYGSTIAVPIFQEIMQNSLRYLKVPFEKEQNTDNLKDQTFVIKDYINRPLNDTKLDLLKQGLNPIVIGDGDKILEQIPVGGSSVNAGAEVYLITAQKSKWLVPNLKGLSLREALNYLRVLEIKVKIEGSGIVVRQSIEPNTLYKGEELTIFLEDPDHQ